MGSQVLVGFGFETTGVYPANKETFHESKFNQEQLKFYNEKMLSAHPDFC